MKVKTILFARVSTREQAEEGYSLPAQEKMLSEYAERKDFNIVKKFSVPESASGKQERKLFNELLEYIGGHPDIKILLCEKVDRISRNFKDGVKLDDWLIEDETRQIHFVKQNLILHKNSRSNEKFMWDIFLAMARQYSNNLSEETKKGLDEKAAQGWYPGNHKRGYKAVGEVGHKTWFVDNEKPDHNYIQKAFELYDTGNYTLRTVAKELFDQGWKTNMGKPLAINEIHILLTDPFYCGEFSWRGKTYQGKHPPLITNERFYRVQERLQRKIKAGKYRKHDFLLGSGLLVCAECNRTVTGELQKGHRYYHCSKYDKACKQRKYVREEKLEAQILDVFDSFKVESPRLLEWIRKALKEIHKNGSEYHEDVVKDLEADRARIEKRLDLLFDEKIDGKINKDFYEKKQKQYEDTLKDVLSAIANHTRANVDYLKLGINIFELAQKGRTIYDKKLLMNEKRELLNFVFSNLKLDGETLTPSLKNGFQIVASRAQKGNWLPGMDSNHNR